MALRRWIIVAVACFVAVWAGVLLTQNPFLLAAGVVVSIYLGTLAVNARPLAWLIIALQPAALIVPFFPGRPFFWELCALLAWPSLLAYMLVNRRTVESIRLDRVEKSALVALSAYFAVLLVLMAFRGVGFRALGGGQMGGRFYTQQLALAILPALMIVATLSRKHLLTAICVGWVMSVTYLISDFSFTIGGGLQKLLYFFELPPDATNFEMGYALTGLRRYQSLWSVGSAILSALLVWMPLRDMIGARAWIALPLASGSILLALSSGHRTVFVQTVLTVLFLSFFQRFWTPMRAIGTFLLGVGTMAALYLFAADLPLPAQRAISFLPGIEVAQLARDNAMDTLNDRIEVLKLAISDVPQYLLLGRGFGMERLDLLPGDEVHSGVWLQYINGQFYNGILGSLLKTGLAGLIATALFIVFISRMALEIVKLVWAREPEGWSVFKRLSLLICAQWFSTVIFFYTLHGDSAVWMKVFGLPAALVVLCRRQLLTADEIPGPLPVENPASASTV